MLQLDQKSATKKSFSTQFLAMCIKQNSELLESRGFIQFMALFTFCLYDAYYPRTRKWQVTSSS